MKTLRIADRGLVYLGPVETIFSMIFKIKHTLCNGLYIQIEKNCFAFEGVLLSFK